MSQHTYFVHYDNDPRVRWHSHGFFEIVNRNCNRVQEIDGRWFVMVISAGFYVQQSHDGFPTADEAIRSLIGEPMTADELFAAGTPVMDRR